MSTLIQNEEEIVLVNPITGETIHKVIRFLEEVSPLKKDIEKKGENKMPTLIQGEEIVFVNHTTGETIHKVIKDLDEIPLIKQLQAMVEDGEFEIEYLRGCLTGDACNYFMELCELARQYHEELAFVGKVFNACEDLDDTALLLKSENYVILRAKSPALAFREYLVELGEFDAIPNYLVSYIDFDKWLNDTSVQVVKTDTPKDTLDRDEFVVYNLI